ncbi:hypothetical protein [Oceanirhabdus sp. W0125-5]|uniref:hypothetical protein n=1 Tax=Oceanirhabdus sp. W0125-5 TaxID=2999116 RepID=UPI0022F2B590|nr:hypothetical protein [Oceanirhabdus sp. W0125-5]WBW96796.1 hypothetical protein OW730_24360 [Oceanirhabdus sp. W0125-5]
MIEKSYIKIRISLEEEINHLYINHTEKTETLVVLYPGGKYTCDKPILHYIKKGALLKGHDVLCINYGSTLSDSDFSKKTRKAAKEAFRAINKCREQKKYNRIIFAGKSIGTVISGKVSDMINDINIKHIFLTPIKYTIPFINKYGGPVIIGSKDKVFGQECIDIIQGNENINIEIIKNAGHSLEVDDLEGTLNIHKYVVKICDDYLGSKD